MIKALIFDFDGVIVESVDIKTDAFRQLFKQYPDHLETLIKYHLHHGGVSRVEKIKYFFKEIIKKPLSERELQGLCDKFSELVVEKVVAAPLVEGAAELLSWARQRFDLFVVSGTPQEEIRRIVERRKLAGHFKEVFGSPRTKKDIVADILRRHKYGPADALLIGDAITDLNAAKDNKVAFIGRATKEGGDWAQDKTVSACFPDMTGVKEWITKKVAV